MTGEFDIVSKEVILIPPAPREPDPGVLGSLRGIVEATVELMGATAATMGGVAQGMVVAVAGPPTSAILDRVVPTVTEAIVQRVNVTAVVIDNVDLRAIVIRALDSLDLTDLVLSRVDLRRIVEDALDQLDLTQVVLDRVDLDAVVDAVELEPVIDRLPITDIAEYVIEQVDLPQIIRQSTGGVAADAMDAARLASYRTDVGVAQFVDRLIFRRRRAVDAPGDPESTSKAGEAE